MPAIGFAAAGMLVGGGGNVLPSERVESTTGQTAIGYVLEEQEDEVLLLRAEDRTAVRVTDVERREVCRLRRPGLLEEPPLAALCDSRPRYALCMRE